jgi:hypothetical protein
VGVRFVLCLSTFELYPESDDVRQSRYR